MALHVDNLLVFTNDEDMVNALKKQLMASFQMMDRGYPEQILAMRVMQANGRIYLDQNKYIEHLLEQFGVVDCFRSTPKAERGNEL